MTFRFIHKSVIRLILKYVLLGLFLLSTTASAGSFSCAISSASGISLTYDPSSPTQTSGTGTLAITCTKSGSNSDTVYYELGINGGINSIGIQSRAANGVSAIKYNTWRDNGLSQVWNDISSNRIKGGLTSTSSSTVYLNYYVSIPSMQTWGPAHTLIPKPSIFIRAPQPLPRRRT